MSDAVEYKEGFNRCFGCGAANPAGLHLTFQETAEGVESPYTVAAHLEGAAGVVHGGIQATLLDETMCMTAYAKLGHSVVTGELTVRYLQPAPVQTPLVVRAHITGTKQNSAFIEGRIFLVSSGEELTRASGRFFWS